MTLETEARLHSCVHPPPLLSSQHYQARLAREVEIGLLPSHPTEYCIMYKDSLCTHPEDSMSYQFVGSPNKSFRFSPLPQTEPRTRPITLSDTCSLEESPPWPEKARSRPYFLVFLTTIFLFLVIALSFHIGSTWDSQFSASERSTLRLEEITQYCMLPILKRRGNRGEADEKKRRYLKTCRLLTLSHNLTARY
jgi:hypothetical protein